MEVESPALRDRCLRTGAEWRPPGDRPEPSRPQEVPVLPPEKTPAEPPGIPEPTPEQPPAEPPELHALSFPGAGKAVSRWPLYSFRA
jgi:hypothetical protein